MLRIEKELPLLEDILAPWREVMGDQAQPYTNHVYRVLHYCFAVHPCLPVEKEKLTIAGAFHDIGLWSAQTVDYLAPSIHEAQDYLAANGKGDWAEEIGQMILWHHKFRRIRGPENTLIEVFRKGDWIDASMGWRRFSVPSGYVKSVQNAFPNLGFHDNLLHLTWQQLKKHPFRNPLPMMRW